MSILPQNPRFIDSNGDPLPRSVESFIGHSKELTLWAGLTAAFTAAALPGAGLESLAATATHNAIQVGGAVALNSFFFRVLWGVFDPIYGMKGRAIDKEPVESSNILDKTRAYMMARLAGFGTVFTSIHLINAMTKHVPDLVQAWETAQPVADEPIRHLASTISFTSLTFARFLRFNEVAKGNWSITDQPKRVKKTKEATAPSFGLANPV